MLEILQGQQAQFDILLAMQQAFGRFALLSGDKRHRRLMRQTHTTGPGVSRQPELDFGAGRGIAPMPGQDEALL
ncbi:hypothetical protein D3C78_1678790 [compost metagenome]